MRHGGSRKGLHMNGTIRTVRNEHGGGEGLPTEVEVVGVSSPNEGALSVAEAVLLQKDIQKEWVLSVIWCTLPLKRFPKANTTEKIPKSEHHVIKLTHTIFFET